VRSAATAVTAVPVSAVISRAAASNSSAWRAEIVTWAPSRASARAHASEALAGAAYDRTLSVEAEIHQATRRLRSDVSAMIVTAIAPSTTAAPMNAAKSPNWFAAIPKSNAGTLKPR
jgi:hypothetical protein